MGKLAEGIRGSFPAGAISFTHIYIEPEWRDLQPSYISTCIQAAAPVVRAGDAQYSRCICSYSRATAGCQVVVDSTYGGSLSCTNFCWRSARLWASQWLYYAAAAFKK